MSGYVALVSGSPFDHGVDVDTQLLEGQLASFKVSQVIRRQVGHSLIGIYRLTFASAGQRLQQLGAFLF